MRQRKIERASDRERLCPNIKQTHLRVHPAGTAPRALGIGIGEGSAAIVVIVAPAGTALASSAAVVRRRATVSVRATTEVGRTGRSRGLAAALVLGVRGRRDGDEEDEEVAG